MGRIIVATTRTTMIGSRIIILLLDAAGHGDSRFTGASMFMVCEHRSCPRVVIRTGWPGLFNDYDVMVAAQLKITVVIWRCGLFFDYFYRRRREKVLILIVRL